MQYGVFAATTVTDYVSGFPDKNAPARCYGPHPAKLFQSRPDDPMPARWLQQIRNEREKPDSRYITLASGVLSARR